MTEHIQNAIIESTSIDDGGRGALTAWLHLKYGDGSHQGFGGYALYLPPSYSHHKLESPAGHFIWRCMEIAGVTSWDKVQGKTIRVKSDKRGFGGSIIGIGHIINDDWFYPAQDFARSEAA